jgi:hypothetical protein
MRRQVKQRINALLKQLFSDAEMGKSVVRIKGSTVEPVCDLDDRILLDIERVLLNAKMQHRVTRSIDGFATVCVEEVDR